MVTCPHRGCGIHIFFVQIFISSNQLIVIDIGQLSIVIVWLLVDPPNVPLTHYGKWEVTQLVSNMEPEFNLILSWTNSMATEAPEVLTQWSHSIIIAGDPKRVTGSKRKSFMADMYGFKMDGELAGVSSYLRSHSGFEIKQVLA